MDWVYGSYVISLNNMKTKVEISCKGCGTAFYTYNCRLGKKIFCKKDCYSIWQKTQPSWNKGLKGFRVGEKRPWMSKKGQENPNWISDRTLLKRNSEESKQRRSSAYNFWSMSVKNRDGWKCRISNGDCSGRLESHHILGWKSHPDLRYQPNNGITLCHFHHPRTREKEAELSPYFQELVMKVD